MKIIKNDGESIIIEFNNQELAIIEEGLLRACANWNRFYIEQGMKYEDITDETALIRNKMHDEIYKILYLEEIK